MSPLFRSQTLNDLPVRVFGWKGALLLGDPSVFDRWRWLRRQLIAGDLRTLDAGSGSGVMSLYAASLGNEVVGISYVERDNQVATGRARMVGLARATFLTRDLRAFHTYAHELGRFDQIICLETIEHIVDDQTLVSALAAVLYPGGRLLVTTPSLKRRRSAVEVVSDCEDGGHVHAGYTKDDLRCLFENAGLHPVSFGYATGPVSQLVIQLQHWIGGRVSPLLGWALAVPLRPLQFLDTFVGRFSSTPYMCVAGVAVRR